VVVAIVAVVATALLTPVATIKQQSWQLQIDTNYPKQKRRRETSGAKEVVAAATTALPTLAVTNTEFKPKEVLEKLKKNLF
jgi:hypothetical protein